MLILEEALQNLQNSALTIRQPYRDTLVPRVRLGRPNCCLGCPAGNIPGKDGDPPSNSPGLSLTKSRIFIITYIPN